MNAKKQRKAEWKKEICVDDVDLAKAAMESGCFDSMELCSNLNEGGTTPSLGFITRCCEIRSELGSNVLFRVLIRCRSGDFCYSDEEMNVMIKDVIGLKELSEGGSTVSRTTTKIIHGIVFGVLKQGNEEVDLVKFRTLTNFAKPHFEVTFHRAIDVCVDYNKCFALLLEESNQIDRILTSFGKPTCDEVIKHQSLLNIDVLLDKSKARNIQIAVGGGLNSKNYSCMLELGISELHGSFRVKKKKLEEEDKNKKNFGEFIKMALDESIVKVFL